MSRLSYAPAIAVILSLFAGLASSRIEEPRYVVTMLHLDGPTSIAEGRPAELRLRVALERIPRDAPAALRESALASIDRARPELVAGTAPLTATLIDVERLRRDGQVTLTLHCAGREVSGLLDGRLRGSGAGARARSGRMGLPWFDQPATVRARIGALESNPVAVLCDG